ncbi:MAG: hypothetical protein ACI80S_000940 [Pseudohongiellaceae bacterium]|jgi:hypothetical protein
MLNLLGSLSGKISLLIFIVFVCNIFYGKTIIYLSLTPLFTLPDIAEFLLLFLACLFFVVYTLAEELLQKKRVK